ncbi:MAG: SDR family oxidoreductase, partial [Pseudomonadota bacterium]
AICPGFTDTDLAESAIIGLMTRFDVDRAKATKMVTSPNPQGRLINPEEVAATAVFLASEGAKSINGHALSVSGGEI